MTIRNKKQKSWVTFQNSRKKNKFIRFIFIRACVFSVLNNDVYTYAYINLSETTSVCLSSILIEICWNHSVQRTLQK